MVSKKKQHKWQLNYPQGVEWQLDAKPKPLYNLLLDTAKKYPENIYLEFEGKEYTYQEVLNLVGKVAAGLESIGIKKGSKVGLLLPNCPYFIISYYAVLKLGAIIVNFSPLYTIGELSLQMKNAEPEVLITIDHRMLYEKASNLLQTTSLSKLIVGSLAEMLPFPKNKLLGIFKAKEMAAINYGKVVIKYESFFEINHLAKDVIINPDIDVAVLQYTGGTTGVPKAAMLSHANLYMNALQCSNWFHGLDEGRERMLAVIPLFHIFAMTAIMNFATLRGFTMILVPKLHLADLLKLIAKSRPTILPAVPSLFAYINNYQKLAKYDLTSLKAAVSGGAALPIKVKQEFETNTGCKLIEGYGLTEASPVVAANPLNGVNKEGSIGMPLPATNIEIRAREGTRKILKTGEIGEICVTGPQVMLGYYKNEKETKEVLRAGRLHTGDLGYMDDDGYIFVVDRIKEIIITLGFNVYPREIEELLYKHNAVVEAAVVGVKDEVKGEIIKAFVKLRPYTEIAKEELISYLSTKLAKYKIPEEIVFVEDMPKTLIGKIAKRKLHDK